MCVVFGQEAKTRDWIVIDGSRISDRQHSVSACRLEFKRNPTRTFTSIWRANSCSRKSNPALRAKAQSDLFARLHRQCIRRTGWDLVCALAVYRTCSSCVMADSLFEVGEDGYPRRDTGREVASVHATTGNL